MAYPNRIGKTIVALSSTLTTNILNCAITSLAGPVGFTATQPYLILNRIRVVNKHASIAATFNLYIGATGANAAGTEFLAFTSPVAVGSYYEAFPKVRMDSTDFLVGGSNTATALTIEIDWEIGFS